MYFWAMRLILSDRVTQQCLVQNVVYKCTRGLITFLICSLKSTLKVVFYQEVVTTRQISFKVDWSEHSIRFCHIFK